MKQIGNRIFYDKVTGEIFYQTGEMEGNVIERANIQELSYIDLPFGFIDYSKNYITHVNVKTGLPIAVAYHINESEEQKRIKELEEDIKLLQADAVLGGIL